VSPGRSTRPSSLGLTDPEKKNTTIFRNVGNYLPAETKLQEAFNPWRKTSCLFTW